MPDWTIERVRALSAAEIRSLEENVMKKENSAVAALCAQALAEIGKPKASQTSSGKVLPFDDSAVAAVTAAIEALIPASEEDFSENVRENINRRRGRVEQSSQLTLADLWWQYVVCAFSSQEKSGRRTAVHLFEHTGSLLHSLLDVANAGAAESWVSVQFDLFEQQCACAGIPRFRFIKPKADIIIKGYPLFARASAPANALTACCLSGGELKVFCDLARGTLSDRNLSTSAQFSQNLDPKPFHGISHKQIRNILLNSGLCSNVLPLDSRWKKFLQEKTRLPIEGDFGKKDFYLAVEDLLRRALISILAANPAFPVKDLSTLDAVVFEYFD